MLTLSMHCLTEVTHCFSEVRDYYCYPHFTMDIHREVTMDLHIETRVSYHFIQSVVALIK